MDPPRASHTAAQVMAGVSRMNSLTIEDAKAVVEAEIASWFSGCETGDTLVILDEETIEKKWGWVFFFTSRKWNETGDLRYAIAGNAPYLVERASGRCFPTGTAYGIEHYIDNYERTGDPHG